MSEITFTSFWQAYGLKRDRLRAERAWNSLSQRDKRAAYAGIAAYREQCQRSGAAMMYGQGYLNNRRWESGSKTADTSPTLPFMKADADMMTW